MAFEQADLSKFRVRGLKTLFDSDGDNTAQAIKAGAGQLIMLEVSNINAADAFVQLFDLATGDVTVGTTTPRLSFLVPAGDGSVYGHMEKIFIAVPISFEVAITYACTLTPTGSGGPTTGLTFNALYI